MDYEKVLGEHKFPTYEELKNGLLRLIDEGKISLEDVARLLPELRESEDEKIRNCLRCLTSLDQAQDVIADMGFTRQDLLAYLEKHKESLHIPESCKENADSLTSDEPTPSVILDEQGRVFATQQKEQKPAWSDEDERNIRNLESVLYYDKHLSDETRTELGNFLKSLPNRLNRQPKTEWSEEDERMWKSALWHIKNSCGNGGKNSGEFEVYQWFENRLKSLRPSWKPSKEQIMALMDALRVSLSEPDMRIPYEPLSALYEQLKKL